MWGERERESERVEKKCLKKRERVSERGREKADSQRQPINHVRGELFAHCTFSSENETNLFVFVVMQNGVAERMERYDEEKRRNPFDGQQPNVVVVH